MTKEDFIQLLKMGESQSLEWKRDWPQGLLKGKKLDGKKNQEWDKGQGELLKDLISFANNPCKDPAYLIYGVKDYGSRRDVFGISKHFDDATFQQWAKNTYDPPPSFFYIEIKWNNQKDIGMFIIEKTSHFPHVIKKNIGGIIYQGQVWYRVGTQNNIALHVELKEMFILEVPFKIYKLNDQILKQIKEHYLNQGRDTDLRLMKEKDSLLYQGYEIALWPPGSRREVWVGEHHGRYEHILLLKQKK